MKIGDLTVIVFCIIMVVIMIRSCVESNKKEQAFNECIEEVSSKCSRSIGYAIALETENARLNQRLKECKAK